jgi:small subunit ribosomal protein S21
MAEIIIKDGESLEQVLRKFKRITAPTRKELRKREHYVKPGLAKRLKSKEARIKAKKFK